MASFKCVAQGRGLEFKFRMAVASMAIGALAGCFATLNTSSAFAAPPELWTQCDKAAPTIQCTLPRGVGANQDNGHVYVADQINRRVDEFNSVGQFIKAWGWDVVEGGGTGFEICAPKSGDTCKAGISGSGVGQFSAALGVALDSAGDIYVIDFSNHRVEVFAPSGEFLLMFGGEVNKTKSAEGGTTEAERNLCTKAQLVGGDICGAGTLGVGNGQFGLWAAGSFIAIDPADKIYVGDQERIQRFDAGGVYQAQCSLPAGVTVQGLAADGAGDLYASYGDEPDVRKIRFVPGGACEELVSPRFKLPETGSPKVESTPTAVAVDGAGHVFAFGPVKEAGGGSPVFVDPIHEFDSTGKEIDHWGKEEFTASNGLATNLCAESEAPGNVYVTNAANGVGPPKANEAFLRAYGTEPIGCFKARTGPAANIVETGATLNGTVNPDGSLSSECRFEYGVSESYGQEAPCAESPAAIGEGTKPVPVHADLGSLTKGTVYHFRLLANVGGETETGADEGFKTLGPPVISADHAAGASDDEATLKALVNPEGFATTYHFEYGLDETYGQSTATIAVGKDRSDHAVLVNLKGLTPGTTYHWRIVATNSSGTTESKDHVLTTFRLPQGSKPCANDAFRTSASTFLPDCRAYEMVSPIDKNGGDIIALEESYFQATPDGDKLTYTTQASFGDAPGASIFNQYIASRGEGGWSNHGIGTPVHGEPAVFLLFGLTREFMAFTPDLCSAWLVDYQTPPPTADGQLDNFNLYRRENCEPGEGGLEALTPSPPALPPIPTTPEFYVGPTSVQGVSDNGDHALFVATAPLPQVPKAAAGNNAQIYDSSKGQLSLVSVRPNGSANVSESAVGSGWAKNLQHAVSSDGSHVYWTADFSQEGGKIYLRRHPEQGIVSGECSEATKACTVPVSGTGLAFFWGASADGTKALYSEVSLTGKTNLFVFEEGQPARKVANEVQGVLGMSEDLSRIYFISRTKQAGVGPNGKGKEAIEGAPNLYLDEGGTLSFIATVAEGDVGAKDPGAVLLAYDVDSENTNLRATRVSANGEQLAFESRAPLTGFDNTAEGSSAPAVEVFLYDASSGELHCVSCNPSGARPAARELTQAYNHQDPRPTKVQAAAWIPTWQQPLHAANALAAGGGRLFFNSNDALLPRDTNGAQDVYEWEEAGVGGCAEEDPSYFPQNGGCLALISSGESPYESEFWEASENGDNVFFTTESSLLPQDPGLIDLYAARVGGGFPQPNPAAQCEGEACQNPPPPPVLPTPASAQTEGAGNVPPSGCPKGKHKVRKGGKARCVPNKHGAKHKKARQRKAKAERRAKR